MALLTFATLLTGFLLRGHVQNYAQPLLNPAPFAVASFRAVMVTGTVMRTLISAVPFLLPLLFQLGFGLDPFRSGLLVLLLFAGNLGMKPLTSFVLRRWGFRTVLAGNGLLQAVTMFGCSMLSPTTPIVVVAGLLMVSGASRSLQFTALGTLAFADVPQRWMAPANTLFSVAFQLALGLGVAFGALALRGAGFILGDDSASSLGTFHGAFGALGVLMVIASFSSMRLAANAGTAVSGHAPVAR
jgi:hypothetical protein